MAYLQGIDISKWQAALDLGAVAAPECGELDRVGWQGPSRAVAGREGVPGEYALADDCAATQAVYSVMLSMRHMRIQVVERLQLTELWCRDTWNRNRKPSIGRRTDHLGRAHRPPRRR